MRIVLDLACVCEKFLSDASVSTCGVCSQCVQQFGLLDRQSLVTLKEGSCHFCGDTDRCSARCCILAHCTQKVTYWRPISSAFAESDGARGIPDCQRLHESFCFSYVSQDCCCSPLGMYVEVWSPIPIPRADLTIIPAQAVLAISHTSLIGYSSCFQLLRLESLALLHSSSLSLPPFSRRPRAVHARTIHRLPTLTLARGSKLGRCPPNLIVI